MSRLSKSESALEKGGFGGNQESSWHIWMIRDKFVHYRFRKLGQRRFKTVRVGSV